MSVKLFFCLSRNDQQIYLRKKKNTQPLKLESKLRSDDG